MKAKLIILTAVVAALLYSCSSDRDENITPVTEKTRPENLKLNTLPVEVSSETSSKIDTINLKNGNGTTGGEGINPGDGETIDPTKPDKPW